MKFLKNTSALMVLCGLAACESKTENLNTFPDDTPATEVFVVKKGMLSSSASIPGELIAFQQVDLYAKVSSFIKKLHVDVGSKVKEGQLLATMEAPEISAQLSGAASRLEALEATYHASKAHYERLLETSKTPGTISPNDLDMALAKQKADYAQLQAAKAQEKEITDNQNYLSIRAPFSGIITARNVSAGAYVGPTGKGSEMPIFTLQQQDKLRLVVAVPETYSNYLSTDKEINFTIQSLPGQTFNARIERLAGALDSRIRSQRIEADVKNVNNKLLPGMITRVQIPLPSRDSVYVIPSSALVSAAEGVYVVKVQEGKAKKTAVQKGREVNNQLEVFGNLQPGDSLVLKAHEEIRENEFIR